MQPAKRRRSPRKHGHGSPHRAGVSSSATKSCSPNATAPVELVPAVGIYEDDDLLSDSGDGPDMGQCLNAEPEEGTTGAHELGPAGGPLIRGLDGNGDDGPSSMQYLPGQQVLVTYAGEGGGTWKCTILEPIAEGEPLRIRHEDWDDDYDFDPEVDECSHVFDVPPALPDIELPPTTVPDGATNFAAMVPPTKTT